MKRTPGWWRAVATVCCMMGLGCRTRPPEQVPVVSDSMARTILRLAQEQLHAGDPVAIERVRICETSRVSHLVGSDSLVRILKTVNSVIEVIEATSTPADRERVKNALGGKQYVAEVGCDTMAAAGLLGGPWLWEVPRRLPGDTLWRGKE